MSVLERFHFDLRGPENGQKLVFLHGLMGSWTNWRRILMDFESQYRILSFDQRGHGRSFKPANGYSPEDFAQDLHQILDELGWGQIHLVGHSMGGRNAMVFASLYPSKIKSLVIEDIGPEGNPQSAKKIEAMLAKVPTPFSDRRQAKEFILAAFQDQVLANYLYSNITETEPGIFDWRFSKPAILQSVTEGRSQDRWKEWESLSMPTLLVRGQESDELDAETYVRMLSRQKNARGVEIPGAGHWVHSDQPKLFSEALQVFFNTNTSS